MPGGTSVLAIEVVSVFTDVIDRELRGHLWSIRFHGFINMNFILSDV